MRALVIEEFGRTPVVADVPEPTPTPDGVVVRVSATGLCRSDWHALAGHDPDITLPHVPGHEFAGVVEAVGPAVVGWRRGDRVTAPFVNACGSCPTCRAGDHQVCPEQTQPGFSRWGSFAELVLVDRAMVNLVSLPQAVTDVAAAALGCRFATAYRALVHVARVRPGEWVAVHGCGGVGLSAVMVAVAAGARVVAVDVTDAALELARRFGAEHVVLAGGGALAPEDVVAELTGGGAHVSMDAFGSPAACAASVACLRPRGRHLQVGLLPSVLGPVALPMHLVIGRELQVLGSHGMAAHAYPEMLGLVESGRLRPDLLVSRHLTMAEAGDALVALGQGGPPGVAVLVPS